MNKLKLTGLTLLLLLGGCKLKGDKGDRGDQGPGALKIYSGTITSDNFTVNIKENAATIKQFSIYLNDGTEWLELPYFLPGSGVNAYALLSPFGTSENVQFVNCHLAGGTQWQVVFILN